jgi:hypothetical protein
MCLPRFVRVFFFSVDLMGDDDDGNGATGNGATGYDDYNDGDWQRRQ